MIVANTSEIGKASHTPMVPNHIGKRNTKGINKSA
jgi:hypothetical protein